MFKHPKRRRHAEADFEKEVSKKVQKSVDKAEQECYNRRVA